MQTRILTDIGLEGSLILTKNESTFPSSPALGTMILKDNIIYVYTAIGGLETWYPFGNRTRSYIHTQGISSTTWTVTHNLGTSDVWIQITDTNGNIIYATKDTVDSNSFTLDFTSSSIGTCIVVAPDSIEVPVVTATLINVGSGVVIGSNSITVSGNQVLTTLNQTTLQNNINAEITRATNAEATLTANLNAEITRATGVEGSLGSLSTTAQSNLVAAINEVYTLAQAGGGGGASTAQLNAEITRATNAEATLTANLNAEITRATNAESTLTTNLNAEITRATNAETTLQANINTEITRATNAETTNAANILVEKTRAMAAEASIASSITTTTIDGGSYTGV